MTAKPVPEHISDERLDKVIARLKFEFDGVRTNTAKDILLALTELQHRREAEAAPVAWIEKDALAKFAKDPHALTATVYRHQLDDTWAPLFAASPSSPASGVRLKATDAATDEAISDVADITARAKAMNLGMAKYLVADVERVLSALGEHP